MPFKTILVGLDGSPHSQRALEAALSLAKPNRARLLLAGVIPFPEDALDAGLHWRTRAAFSRALEASVDLAKRRGVKATPLLLDGRPGDELAWLAKKSKVDLLVVGSWGKSFKAQAARALLGSVARELAQKAPCSVLVVR